VQQELEGKDYLAGFVLLLLFGLLFDKTFWLSAILLALIGSGLALWVWDKMTSRTRSHENLLASQALRREELRSAEESLEGSTRKVLAEHLPTLARKRMQLLQPDDYGITDQTRWNKELDRFVQTVLLPRLSSTERALLIDQVGRLRPVIDNLIDVSAAEAAAKQIKALAQTGYGANLTARDFEHWCAAALRHHGWEARATPGSGDQGADVIAEAYGHRVVIQCKLYTKPVGNKAVQEVHSARAFYGATAAAVISTAGFTTSARALAASTGVLLMDRAELPQLRSLVSRSR
jgi:restriction system protein